MIVAYYFKLDLVDFCPFRAEEILTDTAKRTKFTDTNHEQYFPTINVYRKGSLWLEIIIHFIVAPTIMVKKQHTG